MREVRKKFFGVVRMVILSRAEYVRVLETELGVDIAQDGIR